MSFGKWAAAAVVGLAAGDAAAQQPGFQAGGVRPVPVVTPPQLNPTVLRALNPVRTGVTPGYYTPPVWGYNPWAGPVVVPPTYTPPAVVQQLPGQYLRLPDGRFYNPTTGSQYSQWTNTFTIGSNRYGYNPWTGTYTNPVNGGSFDPTSGTLVRPAWGAGGWVNPWGQ